MQAKKPVGRPRKIKEQSLKEYIDTIAYTHDPKIAPFSVQSHTRERVDALEETIFRMKLVLLSMSEAIEREDFDNLSKEVCRILNI